MEDRRLAQADQALAALRDDIDLLTYKIAHLEVEQRSLKMAVALAFMLAIVLPLTVYYAVPLR